MRLFNRKKLIEAQLHKGYTDIYDDLITIWSRNFIWSGTLIISLGSLLIFLVPFSSRAYSNWTIGVVLIGLLTFVIFYFFVLLILSITVSSSINPLKEVSTLAVRILTGIPQPYSQSYSGLSYREVLHLKRIAEIDQGAADWRGSFVSFVIIGTISIILWGAPFVWQEIIETPPSGPSDSELSAYMAVIEDLIPLPPYAEMVAAVIVLGVLVWIIVQFLNYFRQFLSGEVANRVLLKACEEALAFLEKHNLTEKSFFSFREKKAIAAHFGCKIVSDEEASFADQLWTWGYEPDGSIWYLVPPARHSVVQNIRISIRRLTLWFRAFFSR